MAITVDDLALPGVFKQIKSIFQGSESNNRRKNKVLAAISQFESTGTKSELETVVSLLNEVPSKLSRKKSSAYRLVTGQQAFFEPGVESRYEKLLSQAKQLVSTAKREKESHLDLQVLATKLAVKKQLRILAEDMVEQAKGKSDKEKITLYSTIEAKMVDVVNNVSEEAINQEKESLAQQPIQQMQEKFYEIYKSQFWENKGKVEPISAETLCQVQKAQVILQPECLEKIVKQFMGELLSSLDQHFDGAQTQALKSQINEVRNEFDRVVQGGEVDVNYFSYNTKATPDLKNFIATASDDGSEFTKLYTEQRPQTKQARVNQFLDLYTKSRLEEKPYVKIVNLAYQELLPSYIQSYFDEPVNKLPATEKIEALLPKVETEAPSSSTKPNY